MQLVKGCEHKHGAMSCKETSTSWNEGGIREGSPEEVTLGSWKLNKSQSEGRVWNSVPQSGNSTGKGFEVCILMEHVSPREVGGPTLLRPAQLASNFWMPGY